MPTEKQKKQIHSEIIDVWKTKLWGINTIIWYSLFTVTIRKYASGTIIMYQQM